jgi:hypothetical protein
MSIDVSDIRAASDFSVEDEENAFLPKSLSRYKNTWTHIPEDGNHHSDCRDDLKSRQVWVIGFEVLTATVMKCSIFWNMLSCSPLKVRFAAHHIREKADKVKRHSVP